jgi:hypothetical protein
MTNATKKIKVENATDAEIARFLSWSGLDVPADADRNRLLAMLSSISEGKTIQVIDEPGAGEGQEVRTGDVVAERSGLNKTPPSPDDEKAWKAWLQEKVSIQIDTEDKPGGDDPLPVKHDGRTIFIPRGKTVKVARKFVKILEDAVAVRYDNDDNEGLVNKRIIKTIPWRYA